MARFQRGRLGVRLAVVLIAGLLAACGGGGGDGGGGGLVIPPNALPTLVEDNFPAGSGTQAPANLYALSAGDTATFRKLYANGDPFGSMTRAVASSPLGPSHVVVTETIGSETESITYVRSSDGLSIDFSTDITAPPLARSIIGTLLEYPSTLPPPGTTRTSVRQGSWGADLDSDGATESFRLTFRQVFAGYESLHYPGRPLSAARFNNTIELTLFPSRPGVEPSTAVVHEVNHFVPAFGLVKRAVRVTDGAGNELETPYTLELQIGNIGGVDWGDFQLTDGTRRILDLVHSAAVYDPNRNVYYAIVPATQVVAPGNVSVVPPGANTIATIDPDTGAITFSAPIGDNPGTLAINSDASALYVGMLNQPEIARVALPSMNVTDRLTLDTGPAPAAPQYAQHIQASPVDPDTFAATLSFRGGNTSASAWSTVLVRNMVTQPDRIESPYTSANAVAFSSDGTRVYGLVLSRSPAMGAAYAVTGTGLVFQYTAEVSGPLYEEEVIWADMVADTAVHNRFSVALDTFALTQLAPGSSCRRLANARVVCLQLGNTPSGYIPSQALITARVPGVADDAPIYFGRRNVGSRMHISAAQPGRVLVSEATFSVSRESPYTRMIVFTDPRIQ